MKLKNRPRNFCALILCCICSCNGPRTPISIDASPDAISPGVNTVTLVLSATPAMFVYRDGQHPWLVPHATDSNTFELHVTNDYQCLLVCTGASTSQFFDAELKNLTFADGDSQLMDCLVDTSTGGPATVSGQMVQPGTVWIGQSETSSAPNWDFMLSVASGTHDLIAVGNDEMLIRRNLSIAGPTTVPVVDVVQDGTMMATTALNIDGLDGDSVSTTFGLVLQNDGIGIPGSSAMLSVPPSSLLMPSDYEFLLIQAINGTSIRTADTVFDGTETTFTLPPPFTSGAFDEGNGVLTASWTDLPGLAMLQLLLVPDASWSSVQRVSATRTWLDTMGATSLAFDVSPPGYDPTWTIDLSGPHIRELSAVTYGGTVYYAAGVQEAVNGASVGTTAFDRRTHSMTGIRNRTRIHHGEPRIRADR